MTEIKLVPPPPVNADLSAAEQRVLDEEVAGMLGAPDLPTGASNLPEWPAAPVVTEPTVPTPSAEFIAMMSLLSPVDQTIIQQWFPYVFRRNSPYLEGALITTPDLMIRHIRAEIAEQQRIARVAAEDRERAATTTLKEQRAERAAAREESRRWWQQWVEECRARKARIERAKEEVDKRRAEMDEFEKQLEEARKPWIEYVNAAQQEYLDAKATPAPVRPEGSKR